MGRNLGEWIQTMERCNLRRVVTCKSFLGAAPKGTVENRTAVSYMETAVLCALSI